MGNIFRAFPGNVRLIQSGTSTITTLTETTLATLLRSGSETLTTLMFVSTNAAAKFGEGQVNAPASGNIVLFFEKTANANEFLLRGNNQNTAALTVDWIVYGISPA